MIYALELVLGFVLTPVSIVVRGWVLSILWSWFITPVFHAPKLSVAAAAGLSSIVSLLTTNYGEAQDEEMKKKPFWQKMLFSIFISVFMLGVGWVINLFM